MNGAVAVVVLAGGAGRRIGGGKPCRVLASKRLIDHALEQARRWSKLVAVAVRDEAQVQPIDAPIVHDEAAVAGPLSGLIAGLKFARREGREFLLAIPADMPFLPTDLLARLSAAIGDRGCALAGSGGQLHPVCGLWRTSALDRIDDYVAAGRRSLRSFAGEIGCAVVEWPTEAEDPFFNINLSTDLAEAARRSNA